jgi:hypothetical protein
VNTALSTTAASGSGYGDYCHCCLLRGFDLPHSRRIRGYRALFALVGGNRRSLGFPLGAFSGVLEGLQRFYLLNLTSLGSTLLRALLIVVALQPGRGLLTVALLTVIMPLLSGLINAAAVFRHVRLRLGAHVN